MPAFHTQDVIDGVKRLVNSTAISTVASNEEVRARVMHVVSSYFRRMRNSGEIEAFNVGVYVDEPVTFHECQIPLGLKPGDRYGSTGLVVSSDGEGRGIVLDEKPVGLQPGQVLVKVCLQPRRMLDVVTFDVTI